MYTYNAFMDWLTPMEQLHILPSQCRHIEHMHKGVFVKKTFFDKITAMRKQKKYEYVHKVLVKG